MSQKRRCRLRARGEGRVRGGCGGWRCWSHRRNLRNLSRGGQRWRGNDTDYQLGCGCGLCEAFSLSSRLAAGVAVLAAVARRPRETRGTGTVSCPRPMRTTPVTPPSSPGSRLGRRVSTALLHQSRGRGLVVLTSGHFSLRSSATGKSGFSPLASFHRLADGVAWLENAVAPWLVETASTRRPVRGDENESVQRRRGGRRTTRKGSARRG